MNDIDDPSIQAWPKANPDPMFPPARWRYRHRAGPLLALAWLAVVLGSGLIGSDSPVSTGVVDANEAWISADPASSPLEITLEFARPTHITAVWFSPGITVRGLSIIEKP